MNDTNSLRHTVKKRFYPFVKDRGFVRGRSTSLLTPFHRVRADKVQWFEVQWEKYHRPLFVLNFGELLTQEGDAIDETLLRMDTFGCLKRHKGGNLSAWFQRRKPWTEQILTWSRDYSSDEVVDQLIAAFDDLETWWETKSECESSTIFDVFFGLEGDLRCIMHEGPVLGQLPLSLGVAVVGTISA